MTTDTKIIAIETSGSNCSVSLLSETTVLCEYTIFKGNKHDKLCAEFIRRCLVDNELDLKNINAIAISNGPGSFTGLRIGAAIAKGLTIDNFPKLIAVPTLSAMVYNIITIDKIKESNIKNILAIIPSHSNLFYCQKFDKEMKVIEDISIINFDVLKDKLKEDTFVVSNEPIFENLLYFSCETLTASIIGRYAFNLYKKSIFTDSAKLVPIYIQEFIPKMKI